MFEPHIMKRLFKTFNNAPSVLERSTKARKSEERTILKHETKLSDEQLEGWYIMALREVSFDLFHINIFK